MSRKHILVLTLAASAGLAAAACSDDVTTPGGRPTSLVLMGGDGQDGVVRGTLTDSLTVMVQAPDGKPVIGREVQWAVATGGGSVSPASSTTDSGGMASAAWTMGPVAGPATVHAEAAAAVGATFTARAHPRVELQVMEPLPGATLSDSVRISARILARATEIDSVTATVDSLRVDLVRGETEWRGALGIRALSGGLKDLRVNVHSSTGDTAAVVVPFRRDARPRLQVESPLGGTVLPAPRVRVDAVCASAILPPSCTIEVHAGGGIVLHETGEVHATVPLPPASWYSIMLVGRDAAGQADTVRRRLHVGSNPLWSEVVSAGSAVLDFDGERLLYVDGNRDPALVILRHLAGGAEDTLHAGDASAGSLYSGGAIFLLGSDVWDYDARIGQAERVSSEIVERWAVSGDYAAWTEYPRAPSWTLNVPGVVVRRELSRRETRRAGGAGSLVSLGPTGDLVYSVHHYSPQHGAVAEFGLYSSHGRGGSFSCALPIYPWASNSTRWCGTYPVTDGARFSWSVRVGHEQVYRLMVGGVQVSASATPHRIIPYDRRTYYVGTEDAGIIDREGWRTAYPAGTAGWEMVNGVQAVSHLGYVLSHDRIHPPGSTVGGPDLGPSIGRFEFRGPHLFLVVGRTVFQLPFTESPPVPQTRAAVPPTHLRVPSPRIVG